MKKHIPIWAKLLAITFLVVGVYTAAASQEKRQPTRITGKILVKIPKEATAFPAIAGKTLPHDNFPVYLFSWEESGWIRDWLEKLENDIKKARNAPPGSDAQWIVEKRRQDIYEAVTNSPGPSTKTDKNGCFLFDNLKTGEKYLVIGTKYVVEEGPNLLPKVVGPLVAGANKILIVDRW